MPAIEKCQRVRREEKEKYIAQAQGSRAIMIPES
jgi:hypothetical protein